MSSPSPPSPPPPGAPPTLPPPPPTMGSSPSPLPPNPSDTSSITSANYFFGFVITFVVLLLVFVGCGIGSWRRLRLIGTAWDERLQDMDGSPFTARKRGRRRLVRPVFSETWTHPKAVTHLTPVAASAAAKWEGVQPISAAFVWSRSTLSVWARKVHASRTARWTSSSEHGNDGVMRGVAATLRSYVLPRRPRCDHPPRPPVARPPPEAIQIAVMIAMPSPQLLPSRIPTDGPRCVGHSGVGEYQIGVVRIPWPSGEGP